MTAAACPACGCEEVVPLGLLGRHQHVRCRDCGLDRSMEAEELSPCELGEHLDVEPDWLSSAPARYAPLPGERHE